MDPDTRSYILEVLGLVTRWERPVSHWDAIEHALGEMMIALATDDIRSLNEVAMDVERYGPLRLRTRIGDEPQVRAPVRVRERVNRLVHDLDPQGAATGGEPSDTGGDTAGIEPTDAD